MRAGIDAAPVIVHKHTAVNGRNAGSLRVFYLVQADGAGDALLGNAFISIDKKKIIVFGFFCPVAIKLDLGGIYFLSLIYLGDEFGYAVGEGGYGC